MTQVNLHTQILLVSRRICKWNIQEAIIDTIALFIKTVPKKLVMAVLNDPDVGGTNQWKNLYIQKKKCCYLEMLSIAFYTW